MHHQVLRILWGSFEHSWPIAFLLLLFIFIFSILAMQLFGAALPPDPYIRSVSQAASQPPSQSVSQPATQSVSQSVSQSTGQTGRQVGEWLRPGSVCLSACGLVGYGSSSVVEQVRRVLVVVHQHVPDPDGRELAHHALLHIPARAMGLAALLRRLDRARTVHPAQPRRGKRTTRTDVS